MHMFPDLERVIPQQPVTAWAGVYAHDNKCVPQLALDATLAVKANALAASAVLAAIGCPRHILMQAAVGSHQGHVHSIAFLGLMQQYGIFSQM